MRSLRRTAVLVLSCLVLGTAAAGASGCGAGAHYLGGVLAHHGLHHFVRSSKGQRRLHKVFCLYHGHRVLVDVRNGHIITGALNGISAYHSCKGGFGRRR